MLPVQLVFDNQGKKTFRINPAQTFLEDKKGNLWPILSKHMAYERATKYAQTNEIFKEGAYGSFLGGTAGAIISAAIGVITGENVASSTGKGAGDSRGYASDARGKIIDDLKSKGLDHRYIEPGGLSCGFLFFPGEAKSAVKLRLQLVEKDNSTVYNLTLKM